MKEKGSWKPWVLLVLVIVGFVWWYTSNNLTGFSESVETRVVDWDRYSGKWHEVGSNPTWFQRGLTDVTAEYVLLDDGKVKVINSGVDPRGNLKQVEGKAEVFSEGRLKVSFFPFIKSDYNVLYVDEFYSYALVGGGNPRYLWILCRVPDLDGRVVEGLLDIAKKEGYEVDKFALSKDK